MRPPAWAAFFWLAASLGAQGLTWSQDVTAALDALRLQGRELLVLVAAPGEDPYLGPSAEVGQQVVAWAARAFWPLRVAREEVLSGAGVTVRGPVTAPCLLVVSPLFRERARLEGRTTPVELREFLRRWSVVPMHSAAPGQVFRGEGILLLGDGEGVWRQQASGDSYWEWGFSGPYLLLKGARGDLWALPTLGGQTFQSHGGPWVRSLHGGFE